MWSVHTIQLTHSCKKEQNPTSISELPPAQPEMVTELVHNVLVTILWPQLPLFRTQKAL